MIKKGQAVVVNDPDLLDMYCAESVRNQDETERNILVKIRYMLRYPIQHSIVYPDRANENPPIPQGTVCRLRHVRTVTTHDGAYMGYDASFDKCLAEYEEARKRLYNADSGACVKRYHVDPKEFDILARHKRREFDARRVVIGR